MRYVTLALSVIGIGLLAPRTARAEALPPASDLAQCAP
jgi:hypothetical protein